MSLHTARRQRSLQSRPDAEGAKFSKDLKIFVPPNLSKLGVAVAASSGVVSATGFAMESELGSPKLPSSSLAVSAAGPATATAGAAPRSSGQARRFSWPLAGLAATVPALATRSGQRQSARGKKRLVAERASKVSTIAPQEVLDAGSGVQEASAASIGSSDARVMFLKRCWSGEVPVLPPQAPAADPSDDAASAGHRVRASEYGLVMPTEEDLQDIFNELDSAGIGQIGLQQLEAAATRLNSDYNFSLGSNSAPNLLFYLLGGEAGQVAGDHMKYCLLRREQFVEGMVEFSGVLQRLDQKNFNMEQLRTVLIAAFENFDLDGDCNISVDELGVASRTLSLELSGEDTAHLHRYLVGPLAAEGRGIEQQHFEPPFWDKWGAVLGRAVEQVGKKKGLDSSVGFLEKMAGALHAPGSATEKVQRCLATAWDSAEDLVGTFELAVETMGTAVSAQCVGSGLYEALQAQAESGLDPNDLAPLVLLMGLGSVYTTKELDELLPSNMSKEEAVLFAQVFQKHGFSQGQFRALLSCPGIRWETVEAGSVLNDPSDSSLKLVTLGRSEIVPAAAEGGAASCELQPYYTIGEAEFLRGRSLWGSAVVRATEPVTFVSWDPKQLQETLDHSQDLAQKMSGLLAHTMTGNLSALMEVGALMPSAATEGTVASAEQDECAGRHPEGEDLGQVLTLFSGISEEELGQLLQKGYLDQSDVRKLTESLSSKMRLGTVEKDARRLFAHLSGESCADESGALISSQQFMSRARSLASLVDALPGIGLKDLQTVLRCALERIDLNGDGSIDRHELLAAVRVMQLPLNDQQASTLHSYYDDDQDGLVELKPQRSASKFLAASIDALNEHLSSEAEKKGVAWLSRCVQQVVSILESDADLSTKTQLVRAVVWQGADNLTDAASFTLDLAGVCTSLASIWQEVASKGALESLASGDAAPVLLFLGISGASMVHKFTKNCVHSLSEHEALLYAQVFQKSGFTVTEFQKLLAHGGARWESFQPGEAMGGVSQGTVQVVARGRCEVGLGGSLRARVGLGGLLGAGQLLELDGAAGRGPVGLAAGGQEGRAVEPTSALIWDAEALRQALAGDEALQAKVHRLATMSVADTLLNASLGQDGLP